MSIMYSSDLWQNDITPDRGSLILLLHTRAALQRRSTPAPPSDVQASAISSRGSAGVTDFVGEFTLMRRSMRESPP